MGGIHSEAHHLMRKIALADIEPPVYNLNLSTCGHRAGFQATVSFRCSNIRHLSTRGGTPEQALDELLTELLDRFGACPHCGRKGPKDESQEQPQ